MTGSIDDTNIVKRTIGERLQKARKEMGENFSRQTVVDLLNAHPKAPSFKARALLQEGTYKKWETAENAIQLEWIPAICDVLDCDVGYLFGEYEEKKRESSDISAITGLSEKAIRNLSKLKNISQIGKRYSLYNVLGNNAFKEETPIWIMNFLVEDKKILDLLCLFFIVEDMDGSNIVKHTRSNAILIELIGILTNKRNYIEKIIHSKREESCNG